MSEPGRHCQGPAPLVPSLGRAASGREEGAEAAVGGTRPGRSVPAGARSALGAEALRRSGGRHRGVVGIQDTTSGLRADGCECAGVREPQRWAVRSHFRSAWVLWRCDPGVSTLAVWGLCNLTNLEVSRWQNRKASVGGSRRTGGRRSPRGVCTSGRGEGCRGAGGLEDPSRSSRIGAFSAVHGARAFPTQVRRVGGGRERTDSGLFTSQLSLNN